MRNDYRRVSVVVHGSWGTGKSWLADTAPGPRLVLDAEGGYLDTPSPKVVWDPRQPPPTDLDRDTTVLVDVTSWEAVVYTMQHLLRGGHPFESVIVDSFTELQKTLKDKLGKGPDALFDQQAWGKLLAHMELFVRQLRDLTRQSATHPVNVVVVCGTDSEAIKKTFLLQGGLRKSLAGFVDLVGYLFPGRTETGEEIRVLQISPTEAIEAKCRLHRVKVAHPEGFIVEPTIRDIIRLTNTEEVAA
jgi:hypothetical protein